MKNNCSEDDVNEDIITHDKDFNSEDGENVDDDNEY